MLETNFFDIHSAIKQMFILNNLYLDYYCIICNFWYKKLFMSFIFSDIQLRSAAIREIVLNLNFIAEMS